MKHQFSYVLSFVLMLFVSACNQDSGREKVTHIPYKADQDSRWGLIDWEGNPLIEDEFTEKPSAVIEDRFYVKNSDGLYEFYTAEKKFKKIGKEYVRVRAFHDGLAPVVEKDKPVSFIRPDGTVAFTFDSYKDEAIQAVSVFQEGRALFLTNSGKCGYIDVNGKVVIEPIYDKASLFYNNSACVYKAQNEKYGETFLIDKDGKIYFKVNPGYHIESLFSEHYVIYSEKIIEKEMLYGVLNESEEYAVTIDEEKSCDIFNEQGEKIPNTVKKYGEIFAEQIDEDKSYGILNEQGEKILKAAKKYREIKSSYKNCVVFKNRSEEYGLMDKEGDVVIRPKYNYLKALDDLLIYSENDKYGLVSYKGDKICDAIYNEILPFQLNNKYTYALDNNEWILIDKNGKDIHKNSFYYVSGSEYIEYPSLTVMKSLTPSWYDLLVESDYVDVQAEVDKVMKLVKEDGSIDKLSYNTTPVEFANIYDIDYKASDLKDEKWMSQSLKSGKFIRPSLSVKYNANVITPNYERKWKESYWGGGHWENEVTGYSYNNDVQIETFRFYLEPTGKLVDRKQDMFDAVCQWMKTSGYTKLSTNNNNEERISVYWEKKTPFIIKAGVHFTKDYVIIVIGKE